MTFRSEASKIGRPLEDVTTSIVRDHFFDISERKIFDTKLKRHILKTKILLDINLEERRLKLRQLYENEEEQYSDEHMRSMESIEQRKQKLLDLAKQIRYQTELERQEIVNKKNRELLHLKDHGLRGIQAQLHLDAIMKDREKLKLFKERQAREEDCTEKFWDLKRKEQRDYLLQKEHNMFKNKETLKKEFQHQIELREREKWKEHEAIVKERENNIRCADELGKALKADEKVRLRMKYEKALAYRALLDKQRRYKACLEKKQLDREAAYDRASEDENMQKLQEANSSMVGKKSNLLKLQQDQLHYQQCLRNADLREQDSIKEDVIKTQQLIEKKRARFDQERFKRFRELIAGIKKDQKFQLSEAAKTKRILKEEETKVRDFYRRQFAESVEREHFQQDEERQKRENYLRDLRGQLIHNAELQKMKANERQQERRDMMETEREYCRQRDEMYTNEKILYQHPCRL